MKMVIFLPDSMFHQAERMARRLRKSRSAIYREALAEYVVRHDAGAVTEAMNRVAAQVGGRPDPFVRTASRKILKRTEW